MTAQLLVLPILEYLVLVTDEESSDLGSSKHTTQHKIIISTTRTQECLELEDFS